MSLLLLQMKETASRMLTNFSVQAGVNDFYTAQRVFKESSAKVLPQVRRYREDGKWKGGGCRAQSAQGGVSGATSMPQYWVSVWGWERCRGVTTPPRCCSTPPCSCQTGFITCCL